MTELRSDYPLDYSKDRPKSTRVPRAQWTV
jgi:hypothetical protein